MLYFQGGGCSGCQVGSSLICDYARHLPAAEDLGEGLTRAHRLISIPSALVYQVHTITITKTSISNLGRRQGMLGMGIYFEWSKCITYKVNVSSGHHEDSFIFSLYFGK